MKMLGKTIVITGGGSGIGLALARQWVERGNTVIIVGRSLSRLEEALSVEPRLLAFPCDIRQEAEQRRLVEWLAEMGLEADVLVNNAGVQVLSRFDRQPLPSPTAIQDELDTNFTAAVCLSMLFIPLFLQKPEAAIVNITSGLALVPKESAPIYCASKAALSSFTRTLRYQLEATPIKVFEAMAPLVDTAMTAGRGTGKMSTGQFAREVIQGIEAGRVHIPVGKVKLLEALLRISPSLARQIMRRY
ncbi:SDR family NAD(P)-dependent oxidoreductase [Paenibacillus athensensis]|uniref:Oxidoreductase n=1 Tax=Paenibacillus athensensis TaxID=1967502 RepID=A0A4Y8Q4J2_9BACL|nr:SDR family NAD(P)-dependent oxidoreductase [Paenibacillus athensensis]MCD1260797.1 SDR family NAD(P)-dependent oxidoreductase [Paenibacillus athensensis]